MILRCWALLSNLVLLHATTSFAAAAASPGHCPDTLNLIQRTSNAESGLTAGREEKEVRRRGSTGAYPEINLSFNGACSGGSWMEGTYVMQGSTASGAPWYKSTEAGGDQYTAMFIYHDQSCNGQQTSFRWIIDSDEPDPTQVMDLDQDGTCQYWARYDNMDQSTPPIGVATWRIFCGVSWADVQVSISPVTTSTTTTATTTTTTTVTTTATTTTSTITATTTTTTTSTITATSTTTTTTVPSTATTTAAATSTTTAAAPPTTTTTLHTDSPPTTPTVVTTTNEPTSSQLVKWVVPIAAGSLVLMFCFFSMGFQMGVQNQ